MTEQIPKVKLTITQGDVEAIKAGHTLKPTLELIFDKKGKVNLNYCRVEMVWSDDI
tara:strand:- start:1665 stop:1832 length:168 start_codon:yes stop_codon:yes gene_type:complete